MSGESLRAKIDSGFLRVGEDGRIHLVPLKNPFALKIDLRTTDPKVAEEFIELSAKLREIGKDVTGNIVEKALEDRIKEISKELEKLSERLDPVPVESVIQGEGPGEVRFFCECCFLEMTWRNGRRDPIEKSEKSKLNDLAELSDEELTELRAMNDDELESLRGLIPLEFRKGRDYFAHLPSKGMDFIHERGPGISLAKDIRNYLEHVANRNDWEFEVLDNSNKGRILVQINNREKNKKQKFLIAPFGQLSPEDGKDIILISSSQKSGRTPRFTIRGLTSSSVDIERTRERISSGRGDTIFIEDYVQTVLPRSSSANQDSRRKLPPRFERRPIRLGDAVVERMNRELVIVKSTHEIDSFVFANSPRFSFTTRADGNALRTAVRNNWYYADRRRIANDFLSRHSGLTVEFDDRKEHTPRFGKGLVLFEPQKTRYGKSKTWSPSLNTRKVVVNPYAKSLEKFDPLNWKDTLVIFHSRDKQAAASQRRQFETWMANNGVEKAEIGLVTLHTSDPAKVRGNMYGYLKQPELEFAISNYEDIDNSPFGDPLDPVEIQGDLGLGDQDGNEGRGPNLEEPTHIRTLLEELGLDESAVQTGIDPSLQRFLDHETGMDR